MSNGKPTPEALDDLYGALAKDLAGLIQEGTATAADRSVALALLKQAGVVAAVRPGPINDLAKAANEADDPFDEDDEIARQASIFSGPSAGRA